MFQIMLFVGLAQVLGYTHAPFACAAMYGVLSGISLFVLQTPLPFVLLAVTIRSIAAYVIYRILEHYEDHIFIWWWVLVLGGFAMYKGEEYLIV